MPLLPNAALQWLDRSEEALIAAGAADRSGHQGRDVTAWPALQAAGTSGHSMSRGARQPLTHCDPPAPQGCVRIPRCRARRGHHALWRKSRYKPPVGAWALLLTGEPSHAEPRRLPLAGLRQAYRFPV